MCPVTLKRRGQSWIARPKMKTFDREETLHGSVWRGGAVSPHLQTECADSEGSEPDLVTPVVKV